MTSRSGLLSSSITSTMALLSLLLFLLLGVSLSNGEGGISNEWDGIGIISDLNPDDIVTIRGYRGSYLRATTSTNRISSKNRFEDNKMLWKVGTYTNSNGLTGYSFFNMEKGCYLISEDGYLKCQDINQNDDISWNIEDNSFINYKYNNARYFTRLQNNDDNKCVHIDNGCDGDDEIKVKTSYCNDGNKELVYFERVYPLTLSNPILSNTDEQWNSFSNLEGGSNNDLLKIGDKIYIRSFWSGLFLKSRGDGSIMRLESEIDNLETVWIVTDIQTVSGNNRYQFYNQYHQCYMRHKNGKMKCQTDPSDNSYWSYYNGNSEQTYHEDDSTYPRSYMRLENVATSKCMNLDELDIDICDADIRLDKNTCESKDALVYFERIYRYTA